MNNQKAPTLTTVARGPEARLHTLRDQRSLAAHDSLRSSPFTHVRGCGAYVVGVRRERGPFQSYPYRWTVHVGGTEMGDRLREDG